MKCNLLADHEANRQLKVLYNNKIYTLGHLSYEYGTESYPFFLVMMTDSEGKSGAIDMEDFVNKVKSNKIHIIREPKND